MKNKDSMSSLKVFQLKKIATPEKEIKNVQATLATVPSVEAIKEEVLANENEKDYAEILKVKEKKMDELQLIQKANSGQLTKEETQTLLKLMREKIALNQVILEEKMKKFEGKYL
jgi:hypothetical protein